MLQKIRNYRKGKIPSYKEGKDKVLGKAMDQPLNKLVWRLKDKKCKINYSYNKQGIDIMM